MNGSENVVLENATHFLPRDEMMPNTVQTELFALGCTIYEILIGENPYEGMDDHEVERLYSQRVFPALDGIDNAAWQLVIQKCWECKYKAAHDIIQDLSFPSRLKRVARNFLAFTIG